MKRLITLALALVMVFGVLQLAYFTGYAASESYLTFELINNGTEYAVTGCDESVSGSIIIPSTHKGKSVTSVGDYAFYCCETLSGITIPEGITSIGDNAFEFCESLTSITIPSSVTSIGRLAFSCGTSLKSIVVDTSNPNFLSQDGVLFNKDKSMIIRYPAGKDETSYAIPSGVTIIGDGAFEDCELKNITVPSGVTSIGEWAFCGSSITSITIPGSVTSIGDGAFYFCSYLKSVNIPNGVTNIGEDAFAGCTSLVSISVDTSNVEYCSQNGVLFNKDKTVLIHYPANKNATSYMVPVGTIAIGNSAFYLCIHLNEIMLPDSVTDIGDCAFFSCSSLDSLIIPNSVISIGNEAFEFCESLTNITIPNSVTSIGYDAFFGCESLEYVYYSGTEAEWNNIEVGEGNDPLLDARIHFGGEVSIFQRIIDFFWGIISFFLGLFGIA